jgi:two-component system, cell cycle sensor histidine kinase and response regulator CckA
MAQSLGSSGDSLVGLFESQSGTDYLAGHVDAGSVSIISHLIENAPHSILIVDCGLDAIAANSRAREILAIPDGALPGPAANVLGRAAVDRIERLFSSTANTSTASFRITLDKGGATQDIHAMASRITDAAGRTLGIAVNVAGTLWDSPRNVACRPERVEALGLYAAGIVHEFNNLIAVISGRAGLGLMAGGPKAKNRALENVLTAARRASHITKNLLTYSQRQEPQFLLADLRLPITEALSLLEMEFAAARVNIERDLDEVPPVTCDPVQISQVCFNILRNAREAMPEGGTIAITFRKSGPWAVVSIADTGRGIPADMQSRIFDPFVSYGSSQSCKPSGTGLGLFISKEIVLAHGGDISIESTVGKGSTFTIRIPLSRK